MYNREILDIKTVPKDLVIIGGGYIGVELGNSVRATETALTKNEVNVTLVPFSLISDIVFDSFEISMVSATIK